MYGVPAGVHQPGQADETVRTETKIYHRSCDYRIQQFPGTEPTAEIHAGRAGREDRIERSTGRLLHQRHDQNEDGSRDCRTNIIDNQKRLRINHKSSSLLRNRTKNARLRKWLKRQCSQDLGQHENVESGRVIWSRLSHLMALCSVIWRRRVRYLAGFVEPMDARCMTFGSAASGAR